MMFHRWVGRSSLRFAWRLQSTQSQNRFVNRQGGYNSISGNQRRNQPQKQRLLPHGVLGTPGKRPNTMILLPGDYSDRRPGRDSLEEDVNNYVDPVEEKLREEYEKHLEEKEEKKQRWLKNAEPKEWKVEIDERGRSYGRGGRKRAHAGVWIQPGVGEIVVNKRPFTEYFKRMHDREVCLEPFVVTETCGQYDVQCNVRGGGLTGQAGAIRLGIARALNAYDPERNRPALKFQGMLTRDERRVERKKVGKVKARKSPQWVRR